MLLILALGIGFLASLIRARLSGSRLVLPKLRAAWLVAATLLPQLLAFHLLATRERLPDWSAAAILIGSQIALLAFAWANRRQAGFRVLGTGLALNLLVITVNGGFMPISPETLYTLAPHAAPGSWAVGQRLAFGKDVIMPVSQTHLWFLSDCLLLPSWFPYQAAFSIGDVFIALGAFRALWAVTGHQINKYNRKSDHDAS